ncbi:hypothetical protein NBO_28g0034 [Nosema bombycis CQ1]|uniref:Uncharacterized protein n=1 Tax=Nosema bombycis (strain CQ1 / CVCC 102059) TaxID=578461 RepID=R0MJM7_NOSB1|nr:hypothetical protein NBO_28g0034 [Nosema bombycis CQ1]|eukprot:EOB14395.1 hypothetical protein NBO_28g0034 [Nosema bombycis CQ1]
MKCVDKKYNKTYSFNLVLDDNESFMTKPFYYSGKEQKWVLGHSEVDVRN